MTYQSQRVAYPYFDRLTNAAALDEQVVAGKRAFEERNCNDCHTRGGIPRCRARRA